MLNALSFDVEDYYHVQGFAQVIRRSQWEGLPSRIIRNTSGILRLLDEHNVRATFFVLGWVAERYPGLVRDIASAGHEVASHGYCHELIYQQTQEEFARDLQRSLQAIRNACPDVQVLGYRAPSFSITRASQWALGVLSDLGFRYDSSIFPVGMHDRYGVPDAPRFAHRLTDRLCEFPASTVRLFGRNWPVAGGGYFRLYPLTVTKMAIRRLNREGHPAIVYLHPWEFDPEQPKVHQASRFARFRHYVNLHRTEERLKTLLKQFSFGPIREVFAGYLKPTEEAFPTPPCSD